MCSVNWSFGSSCDTYSMCTVWTKLVQNTDILSSNCLLDKVIWCLTVKVCDFIILRNHIICSVFWTEQALELSSTRTVSCRAGRLILVHTDLSSYLLLLGIAFCLQLWTCIITQLYQNSVLQGWEVTLYLFTQILLLIFFC